VDLTKALAPKSDQLDFADLDGLPPQIFTITDVSENGSELADQQPVNIRLAEFPRWWRPSKGMLRVLADNWGKNVKDWVGRQVELYGDPEVYFGKEKRGGTRISRLSHISSRKTTLVNPRGGRGAYWSVEPLPNVAPEPPPVSPEVAALREEWKSADPERRKVIEAEVAALTSPPISGAEPPASDAVSEPQAVEDVHSAPESPICPECVAGKHQNCEGQAWDNAADEPVGCACADEAHAS